MGKLFAQTFTIAFFARSAAAVAVVICGALGYYNSIGAYLMAWVPHITPEIARLIFWATAVLLALLLLVLWLLQPKHRNLWAERDQLELSAIACLSVGKTADQPYDVEPQLSRHRLLKDAVRNGSLKYVEMGGEKPNVHTLVSREQLRAYAKSTKNADLLGLVSRWDRVNPPRRPQIMDAPIIVEDDKFIDRATITQYLPSDAPAKLLMRGWWLHYNPKNQSGKKELTFNARGTFDAGGNDNEFRWQMKNGFLEIYRKSNVLQNRFRYDAATGRFICTNDLDAEGYRDQVIYR